MKKPSTSRRGFIRRVAVLAGGVAVPPALRAGAEPRPPGSDEEICARKFTLSVKESLQTRQMGEVMVALGVSFLGTPYVANTLEQQGDESLVVNLRGLDCVTFVENCLTLARCVKLGTRTFENYTKQLKLIRYRAGVIDGYPSRLHYFSDWIFDNSARKIVRDVTHELGGIPYTKHLNFMSTHPGSYRQLNDEAALARIRDIEASINTREQYYIPKENIPTAVKAILPGDIIAITTSIEGLDVVHTGLAVLSNGIIKYLHAPLSKGKVQITESSLAHYLIEYKKHSGIMVARALDPVS